MKHHYPRLSWAIGLLLMLVTQQGMAQTFVNPLPIPDTIDAAVINLSLDIETHNFNDFAVGQPLNDTLIKTFAFNFGGDTDTNTYLGPTLIWRTGRHQTINVTNNLPDTATVHWHGAHVPAKMDGGPHSPIAPNGGVWPVHFDVLDSSCTLWYHPHAHDETFAQVEMGLSGIIIVEDATDAIRSSLPHRYGVDDFPIIIQERNFKPSIDQTYALQIDTLQHGANGGTRPTSWIINGVTNPYLEVPPQMVRFRVLDGSSRIAYRLGIGTLPANLLPFQLIASDDGYLRNPITVDNFLTGPGIRNELVFDFTQYAGQSLYLLNVQGQAGSGIIGIGPPEQSTANAYMEIRVGLLPNLPVGIIPPFPAIDTFAYDNQTPVRNKNLLGHNAQGGGFVPFSINGNQFDLPFVNDTIMLNATEKWVISNQTAVAHPFHIHDIHFFIIAVDSIITGGTVSLPIPPEYQGPKDNVLVKAGHQVTFVTKFTDFATQISADSAYMYHCHILTHEDGYYALGGPPPTTQQRDHFGMMQQFVVWNGIVAAPDEAAMVDDMTLYPNPATDMLHLRGEYNKASTVKVMDLQGRTVLQRDLAPFNGTTTFDVGSFSKGMYIFEWSSAAGNFTRKVVLE